MTVWFIAKALRWTISDSGVLLFERPGNLAWKPQEKSKPLKCIRSFYSPRLLQVTSSKQQLSWSPSLLFSHLDYYRGKYYKVITAEDRVRKNLPMSLLLCGLKQNIPSFKRNLRQRMIIFIQLWVPCPIVLMSNLNVTSNWIITEASWCHQSSIW